MDVTETQFLPLGNGGSKTRFLNIPLGDQPRLKSETQFLGVCFEGGKFLEPAKRVKAY